MKRTSDRVSTIATRVLAKLKGEKRDSHICWAYWVTVREVRALAASCLAQDEVKGKRKPAKRRKAKA